jgi:alpha-mannosidase
LSSYSPQSIILTAVKKAEEGAALLLRFCEPSGKAIAASVKINSALLGILVNAVEVDILEHPLKKSTAKVKGTTLRVSVPAYGITTILLTLKK